MKTILKYISRNVLEKKGRSILIILSLVIATTVMVLNLTIPSQIVDANANKIRKLVGTSDVLVAGFNYFDLDDVKTNNDDINYVGVNQAPIIHKEKTLMIYGTDIKSSYKQKLVGKNNLNDDEVIMSEDAAKKFNYKAGDKLKLDINGKEYNLKIKYVEEASGLLYFKPYSIVINNETYNKIFKNDTNKFISYYVDVLDDESIDKYSSYIENNNSKEYFAQKLVDYDAIKDNNSYVSLILLIIFIMSVIMIFFVVSTLNKMIIMERTPVIATFRSIGATKKKMNTLLVLENAMYGLIGGLLGVILSIFVNNLCVSLLLGGESIITKVPFINLVIGVVFSIILEIVMSIGAIIKSSKFSIKELMFENLSSKFEINKKSSILSIICIALSIILYICVSDDNVIIDILKITLFWIGIANFIPFVMLYISKLCTAISKKLNNGPLVIASKNLGHNKMIIQSSRLVVVAISIMLVIFNISSRFNNMLDSFSYQFEGYDLFIRDVTNENKYYDKLFDIDGVKDVELVYSATTEKAYNNDSVLDLPPIILGMDESRPDIVELNYKIKDLKSDEVLVDQKYLSSNNWEIGDEINIKLDGYEGTHKYKIVGTVNSFYFSVQREIIIVNEEHFINEYSKVPFQITISTKDNTDLEKLVKRVELEIKEPDAVIMTVDEFVTSQRKNINTIMSLFYVIVGIVIGLSFISIINNQIISFMERKKELAVLNSICMSKGELNRMLIIENILSNFIACLLGFISSLVSVKMINSVLNGIKMYIDVTYNYELALIFISGMMIILFLTVIVTIRKVRKINIVESIKYE